jgi:diguanylate cyclase (GGDEF)-like protein/PAS domain S-box-containing protein
MDFLPMSNSSGSKDISPPERSNVLSWPAFQYAGGTLPVRFIEQVLNTIPIHIIVLDTAGNILWTNQDLMESDDPPASHWSLPGDGIGASYIERIEQASARGDGFATQALSGIRDVMLRRRQDFRMDYRCQAKLSPHWFSMDVRAMTDGEGVIVTHLNVISQKQVELELQAMRERLERDTRSRIERLERRNAALRNHHIENLESECSLRQAASVFLNSSQAVVITDAHRRIIKVNEGFSEISGYSVVEVLGQDIGILCDESLSEPSNEMLKGSAQSSDHWQGEYWSRRRNGETYPAWASIDIVRDEDGRLLNYICQFSDITRLKESQRKLHYLAHHDPLTGLANRLLFWARLEQSIQHAQRHCKRMALLFLDINDFKIVNDTLGHPAGDSMLQLIAKRLLKHVRREDTIARLGGDEFGVIVEDVVTLQDVTVLAEKLKNIINQPMEIGGTTIRTSASIGIGLYPDDGNTPESLYRAADEWMYRSKKKNRDARDYNLDISKPKD